MSELRYARGALVADLVRSGAGALLTGLPLVTARPPAWLGVLLVGLLVLFLAHLALTLRRSRQRLRVDAQALHVLPAGITMQWDQLDEMHLDYFSTRRDGRAGWMQLRLRSGARRLRVDSGLMAFDRVVRHAVDAARARDLELTPATLSNLAHLEGAPTEDAA